MSNLASTLMFDCRFVYLFLFNIFTSITEYKKIVDMHQLDNSLATQ